MVCSVLNCLRCLQKFHQIAAGLTDMIQLPRHYYHTAWLKHNRVVTIVLMCTNIISSLDNYLSGLPFYLTIHDNTVHFPGLCKSIMTSRIKWCRSWRELLIWQIRPNENMNYLMRLFQLEAETKSIVELINPGDCDCCMMCMWLNITLFSLMVYNFSITYTCPYFTEVSCISLPWTV